MFIVASVLIVSLRHSIRIQTHIHTVGLMPMPSKIRCSMKRTLAPVLATLLCAIAFAICNSAWAAPAGFNQAVQSFNGRHYSQALAQFEAISRANPSDTSTHYYMGLCYHYLN